MDNKHQKHATLLRAATGEFGRIELAILGTTCDWIKQLAYTIIQQLPSYKIAYADADHKSADTDGQSVSAIAAGAYAEYVNKISFTQLTINTQQNAFKKRMLLNDCDLILVNGNHFTANNQIVVIDAAKPLEKKLDKLTNVRLILLKDLSAPIPDYLINRIPDIQSVPVFSFADTDAIINHIRQFIQHQTPGINGLVLSGGKSIRMGRDKGDIHYFKKSQRQHVYNLLSQHCTETFISCNHQQAASIHNMPVIEDLFLDLGPAGGILSAFRHNPNAAWLTVACDLPFLPSDAIQFLIRHRNSSKMATAFMDAKEKFPEPLITIWEPKAYPVLLQFLSQGYGCPRKVLINSDIELLHAPDASAFKNINTAEEYKKALLILNNKHNYC